MKNGDIISGTDAYQMALPKMGHDLAMKYTDYFRKKQKAIKTGRLQNSYVDSGRNKVYKSEWATEAKFPECKQSMSEKEITKFFKRVVKSKTYKTLSEKGHSNPSLEFMKTVFLGTTTAGKQLYTPFLESLSMPIWTPYSRVHWE